MDPDSIGYGVDGTYTMKPGEIEVTISGGPVAAHRTVMLHSLQLGICGSSIFSRELLLNDISLKPGDRYRLPSGTVFTIPLPKEPPTPGWLCSILLESNGRTHVARDSGPPVLAASGATQQTGADVYKKPPIAADSGAGTSAQTPIATPIIKGNGASVLFLRFSPNGGELARVTQFSPVMLFDNGYRKARTFPVGMRMVAYSPDGTKIATAEGRDGARVWEAAATGRLLPNPGADEVRLLDTPLAVLQPPDPAQTLFLAEFSPDDKRLITTHSDGHVKVWDTRAWTVEQDINLAGAAVLVAAFAPDGNTIVFGDAAGKLQQWNLGTNASMGDWDAPPSSGGVTGVAFSPDGKTLVTTHQSGPFDALVMLWQNNTAGVPDRITGVAWRASAEWTAQLEPGFASAAFSKDGKLLALGGGRIKLLDASTWKEIRTIELPRMTHREATTQEWQNDKEPYASMKLSVFIEALSFTPNGRTLAAGSLDGSIRLVQLTP
jgi:WD40 repeat protein